ncbi:MAG TPA: cyclic nucleotide-binding domain-containing protein [Chloroflexota bacterium]|nr:cyclic nucleotide-binding domain-containing protein [Chloroflexota bacterium]
MLSTVEKVLLLRGVSIFSETPDDILADVAAIAEETYASAGETIITRGDIGTTMYVIIRGAVRVHAGELTIAALRDRAVFGELAALDPEPRSASVTATEDSHLLSVDHDVLLDLIAERVEVARGIIRFLCQRIRLTTSAAGTPGGVPTVGSLASEISGRLEGGDRA